MSNQIVRLPKVIELTGLSRATIYRLVEKNQFPKPFKIIGRLKGWSRVDIDQWIDKTIQSGYQEAQS